MRTLTLINKMEELLREIKNLKGQAQDLKEHL